MVNGDQSSASDNQGDDISPSSSLSPSPASASQDGRGENGVHVAQAEPPKEVTPEVTQPHSPSPIVAGCPPAATSAFSVAHALSMIRKQRENQERVAEEQKKVLEEQRRERAKEKRQRRRKNQKLRKAQLVNKEGDETGEQDDDTRAKQSENSGDSATTPTIEASDSAAKRHNEQHPPALYQAGISSRGMKRAVGNDDDGGMSEPRRLPMKKRRKHKSHQINQSSSSQNADQSRIDHADQERVNEPNAPPRASTHGGFQKVLSLIPRALLLKMNKQKTSR